MAARHRGRRRRIPEDETSLDSTGRPNMPPGSNVSNNNYYRSRGYIPPPGRGQQGFVGHEDEEEQEEEEYRRGAHNDNPLYEVEDQDNRFPADPTLSRRGQAGPNNNPLYGNDPFRPGTSAAVCMTEFLRPNPGSPHSSNQSNSLHPSSDSPYVNIDGSSDEDDAQTSRRRPNPERSPRRTFGEGLFQGAPGDQPIVRYPPARFSPVLPANQPEFRPKGKRRVQTDDSAASIPPPQAEAPNIGDLIAAVRSDKNLLLGEVRKHANREPRVPGDHDRYFAPRKGDIIIHFTPCLDDKLLEYYDERKSMLRLQPGDKLVRVKYDNYKLPDHLMITSKLYLYAPEWVYLGKALQTIKTV